MWCPDRETPSLAGVPPWRYSHEKLCQAQNSLPRQRALSGHWMNVQWGGWASEETSARCSPPEGTVSSQSRPCGTPWQLPSPCMLVNAFLRASCPPVLALLLQPRMPPGDDIALSLPALWTPVPKLSPGKNFSFSGEAILCVNWLNPVKWLENRFILELWVWPS